MKRILSVFIFLLSLLAVPAQTTTLTFTGRDANNHFIPLNRVVITNLTRGWQETIYAPDTTLTMDDVTGIAETETSWAFALSQNNPNPFNVTTEATLTIKEYGPVTMEISDVNGRIVETRNFASLQAGNHRFRIQISASGIYFMTARQRGQSSTIKIVNNGSGAVNSVEYVGGSETKAIKETKATCNNSFALGDQMEYVAYATINGEEVESEHLTQVQNDYDPIVLTFATALLIDGQPCPGVATLTDVDGNVYNTVQIGNQCWMKENLRTTHYADGISISLGSSLSTTKAYRCIPGGDTSYVSTYGYLYNWRAVMHNSSSSSTNPSEVQGICPNGWHVPSDAEWTQLTDHVSSQSQYVCDSDSINIAKALASTTGWNSHWDVCAVGNNPSQNNATGFNAVPAGHYRGEGNHYFGGAASFWSATDSSPYGYLPFARGIYYSRADLCCQNCLSLSERYLSVRCLKGIPTPTIPTVTTISVTSITQNTAICGGNVTSDGGANVTSRGVCWSTNQPPTINDSLTTDGTGIGNFISNITGLTESTTYYVRAYAINSVGVAYGSLETFITYSSSLDGQPCIGAATLTDVDGNTYNTVQIGTQCWMKENLRTTKYADGTNISLEGSGSTTSTAYRYYPNHSSSNVATYGYLYNWPAVMHGTTYSESIQSSVQGICPVGWHVPSDAEWTQLTNYVSTQGQSICGSDNSYIAKALAYTMGWNSNSGSCCIGNNPSTNNATGFSAVPAGYYSFSINNGFGNCAYFWSSTEYSSSDAYGLFLYSGEANVSSSDRSKDFFSSVRCLRNDSITLPPVTTYFVSNITSTSATCGGNVTTDCGAAITNRGVCWSTSQNPTISDSHTFNGTGTGSFTSTMTGLTANTTYYVRAYATNSEDTAYGEQQSFTTSAADGQPCTNAATLTDVEGNVYNTVQIGQQCWVRENLRTTHYADGTSITLRSSTSTNTAYCYCPNNDTSNVSTYGYLYNWPAVMYNSSSSTNNPSGVQGICPIGWHVPSDAEWTQLTNYVSSKSQYVCGSYTTYIARALASTMGWYSSTNTCAVGNNPVTNNATGFTAVPAGCHSGSSINNDFGNYAYFWSSTEFSSSDAYELYLYSGYANVSGSHSPKDFYFSVRCLRNGSITLPLVTTTFVSNITPTSATCGGNVTTDFGAAVTDRGICYNTMGAPTISDSCVHSGTSTGSFTSNMTGLTAGTIYYVRAYAINSMGVVYGNTVQFSTNVVSYGLPCPNAATVTDIDGNVYNTVQIGNQCWMKENLRTTKYVDGTNISLGSSISTTTAYCYYPNNSSGNVATYGYLYNWPAVMHNSSSSSTNPSGVQGICPNGWHVPSNAEWSQLTNYVNSQSQYLCCGESDNIAKALASTMGWYSSTNTCAVGNNLVANNATGFKAVPAGYSYAISYDLDYRAGFWSATEYDGSEAYCRVLYNDSGVMFGSGCNKESGSSVRCLKD